MTLAEQIQDDASVFINTDDFAEAASYTPFGSTAVDINVVPDHDIDTEPTMDQDGKVSNRQVTLYCKLSDVPVCMAHKDIVVFRGVTFVVTATMELDTAIRRIDAVLVTPLRKSAQGFERTR